MHNYNYEILSEKPPEEPSLDGNFELNEAILRSLSAFDVLEERLKHYSERYKGDIDTLNSRMNDIYYTYLTKLRPKLEYLIEASPALRWKIEGIERMYRQFKSGKNYSIITI